MKDLRIFSLVIILPILTTFYLDGVLTLLGENSCWSLFGNLFTNASLALLASSWYSIILLSSSSFC